MRLTKHHGLGNDFLVLVDQGDASASLAQRLCDRRRGIGADGLISARLPQGSGRLGRAGGDGPDDGSGSDDAPVDAAMVLYNADGSRAEMSGNGIRCLAQALLRHRGERSGILHIATDAGVRRVAVTAADDSALCQAEVDLGPPGRGPQWSGDVSDDLLEALGTGRLRAETVDVGNPHLVIEAVDPSAIDLARFGPALERSFPSGINVEFMAPRAGRPDELEVTVWERGAGITEACGTGASAAAIVARRRGLVGPDVTVHLPGGPVRVRLGPTVTLIGPAVYVGAVEVPDGRLGPTVGGGGMRDGCGQQAAGRNVESGVESGVEMKTELGVEMNIEPGAEMGAEVEDMRG